MPGMVAGGSNMVAGFVAPTNMVMSTPPQTPRSTASSVSGAVPVSALASASGAQGVLVKRAAEVVKEHSADGEAKEDEEGEPERKKRRIVPDFVGQK